MIPHDLDPKEAEARLPFRLLFIGLLLLMTFACAWNAVAVLGSPDPAAAPCKPGKVACELGRLLLIHLPAPLGAVILALVGMTMAALCLWLAWIVWQGRRR